MRKALPFLFLLAATGVVSGQTVTVTASHLGGQNPVNGVITFQPTLSNGTQASARIGAGGGIASRQPVSAPVTNGAFTVTLLDTNLSNPQNLCYNTTVRNATGAQILGPGFTCVQPAANNSWCTNSVCNFDTYPPNVTSLVMQVTGPAGPPGPGCSTGSGVCGMTVPVSLPSDPTQPLYAATKQYVDNGIRAAASSPYGCISTFGDSWVQGTGATNPSPGPSGTAYAYGLLNDFGQTTGNYGTGGDEYADTSAKVQGYVNPTQSNNCVIVIGADAVNDINVYGSDANRQVISQLSLSGMIAQATVPDVAKALAVNTSACVRSGTWANDGPRIYSTTAGSSLTCTVTAYSTTLDYVYQMADGYGGNHTVTVDGGTPVTILNQGPNGAQISTANGGHTTFALQQFVTTPGVHTVVITVGSGSLTEPVWVGGPGYPMRGQAPPVLFISGANPVVLGVGVNGVTPQTQAEVTTYHNMVQNTVATMLAQGHNVNYVPIDDLVLGDFNGYTAANGAVCPAGLVPPWHPGDCGHAKIRHDFEAAIRPVLRSSSNVAAITSGTIDGTAIGSKTPASIGTTHVVITPPSNSAASAAIDFVGSGFDGETLGCWTTGNGAGLAGVCGYFDNGTNNFVWSTNTSHDFFLGTPVSQGNVANGVGSKFAFWHDGSASGPQIFTPGTLSVASGSGVVLPGGVWPKTDRYFLFGITPTSTVASGSQFVLFNFGKTWYAASGASQQNPVCTTSQWNAPDANVRQLYTTNDSATQIGFGLVSGSLASGTTYYFVVHCAGDLEQ